MRTFLRNRNGTVVHDGGCVNILARGTAVPWTWANEAVAEHGIWYLREICAGFGYTECGHCLPLTGPE